MWSSCLIRILIALLFVASTLFSQTNILIKDNTHSFTNFKVEMYEDVNSTLNIDDIQKVRSFESKSNRVSNGYSKSSFWFRFKVTNTTDTSLQYFIQFTENFIDKLECYIVDKNGTYIRHQEGAGFFIKGKTCFFTKVIQKIIVSAYFYKD